MPDVYRALADPSRRRLLALLRRRDMTAGELAAEFDLAWPTVSGHLKVLRKADLVQADRRGTSITYHLNVSVLESAMASLMSALGVGTRTDDAASEPTAAHGRATGPRRTNDTNETGRDQ